MKAFAVFIAVTASCIDAASAKNVDTSYATSIGGIQQWINIKAQDTSHPLMLWLHGGPGGSDMGYANKFSNQLNKRFIFVEWDQRESGRTASINHSTNIHLDQIHQDVLDMINYLLNKFHRQKLFLVGHSWGGFLALYAANKHPELLKACILVSPGIYFHENELMSLHFVRDEAKKKKNQVAMQEIDSIRIPFERPLDLWLLRKWMFTFHGDNPSRALPPEKVFMEIASTWITVIKEWETFNPYVEIKRIDCPIFFLIGDNDYVTHPEIAQQFYDQLNAKTKNIYYFDAGHMITREQPKEMQQTIIKEISEAVKSK